LKAITHDVFSLGVGLYLLSYVDRPPTLSLLVLVVWLSFATNELIDALGHATRGGRPVRSFWTHSVFSAPVLGIVGALVSARLLDTVLGRAMTTPQALFVAWLGAVLAYSHILLDAFTEGGVYIGRRRVALAHLRYDNMILNGAFTGLGVLLVLASFV